MRRTNAWRKLPWSRSTQDLIPPKSLLLSSLCTIKWDREKSLDYLSYSRPAICWQARAVGQLQQGLGKPPLLWPWGLWWLLLAHAVDGDGEGEVEEDAGETAYISMMKVGEVACISSFGGRSFNPLETWRQDWSRRFQRHQSPLLRRVLESSMTSASGWFNGYNINVPIFWFV